MKRYNNEMILVISDTHFPYQHPAMFKFLRKLKKTYKPNRVVHTGDMYDRYHASRYLRDPDHPQSAVKELHEAQAATRRLGSIFPEMLVIIGNHDKRVYNAIQNVNLPAELLVPPEKFFGFPKGWSKFQESVKLTVNSTRQKIMFHHYLGANALINAERMGSCFVQGHAHSKAGTYFSFNGEHVKWALQMPCLINDTGCPFSYNKLQDTRPIFGAAIIQHGSPRIILMQDVLTKKEMRNA